MRRRNRKTKTKEIWGVKIPIFMLPILIVFGIATILLTIKVASSGVVLSNLEGEKARLVRENEELANNLINSGSLRDLREKAEELGFAKPASILYISEKEVVAKLP